jgi:hypothetical protein
MTSAVDVVARDLERLRQIVAGLSSELKWYRSIIQREGGRDSILLGGPFEGAYVDAIGTADGTVALRSAKNTVIVGDGEAVDSEYVDCVVLGNAGKSLADGSVVVGQAGCDNNVVKSIVGGANTVKRDDGGAVSNVLCLGDGNVVTASYTATVGIANGVEGGYSMAIGTQNKVSGLYALAAGVFGSTDAGVVISAAQGSPTHHASSWTRYGRPHAPSACLRLHGEGGIQITTGESNDVHMSGRPYVDVPGGSHSGNESQLVTHGDVKGMLVTKVSNYGGDLEDPIHNAPTINITTHVSGDTLIITSVPGVGTRVGPLVPGSVVIVAGEVSTGIDDVIGGLDDRVDGYGLGVNVERNVRVNFATGRGTDVGPVDTESYAISSVMRRDVGGTFQTFRKSGCIHNTIVVTEANKYLWLWYGPAGDIGALHVPWMRVSVTVTQMFS